MTTPGWYGDPAGLGEARWWDGEAWTHAVMRNGQTATVPLPDGSSRAVGLEGGVAQQVQKSGLQLGAQGGGTVFTEPVLVVNQKAKLFEVTNEYKVFDQQGQQIAAVVEVGQTALRKIVRALTRFDQFMSHTLEVRDASGRAVMVVRQGAKFIRSTTTVTRPDLGPMGTLAMKTTFRKARFEMTDVHGQLVGTLQAENWRAWDFAISDASGQEIARVKKTFEGIAKAMFTTADNYVIRLHRPLPEPLLSLVIASALTIDTALKQGNG